MSVESLPVVYVLYTYNVFRGCKPRTLFIPYFQIPLQNVAGDNPTIVDGLLFLLPRNHTMEQRLCRYCQQPERKDVA